MMRYTALLLFGFACLSLFARPGQAEPSADTPVYLRARPIEQDPSGRPRNRAASSTQAEPATAGLPVDIRADRLEYEADGRVLTGEGHVLITQGPATLRADRVRYNTETGEVWAQGSIRYEGVGRIWEGEELTYNAQTGEGDFGAFTAFFDPFYVTAETAQREGTNRFALTRTTLTTCDGEDPDFIIRSQRAEMINDDTFEAWNAVFYLHGVPFFYLPYIHKYFGESTVDFDVMPGYASDMGPFILTSYNLHPTREVRLSTLLDYRMKRGLAIGEEAVWNATNRSFKGHALAYYLNDSDPNPDDEAIREGVVDNERYRLSLQHRQTLTPTDYLIAQATYLSDPYVLEDFFYEDYRASVQPENRVSLAHRGDGYVAGLLINKRLNDFYENVDRAPEAYLDFNLQPVGDTGLFYEGDNSAAYLERVYPNDGGTNDYDAFRLDSAHMLNYPTRHWGFLNVIPRAGYRGTYYSKTYTDRVASNTFSYVDTNGVPVTWDAITTNRLEDGSRLRSLFELGFETSFKAFKVLSDRPTGLGRDIGLRHVVEPYADYTFVPEPNVEPENLPQFDAIDALGKRNDVLLGMRNKLQTKRRGAIHDLINIDLYTLFRLDPDEGVNDFSDLYLNSRFRVWEAFAVDVDLAYDTYAGEFSAFDGRGGYVFSDGSTLSGEYLYRRDAADQAAGRLALFPNDPWSFEVYARYNLDSGRVDEHTYMLTRKTDCLGYGLGFRERDDTYEVWAQIWLIAFPHRIGFRQGYDQP